MISRSYSIAAFCPLRHAEIRIFREKKKRRPLAEPGK